MRVGYCSWNAENADASQRTQSVGGVCHLRRCAAMTRRPAAWLPSSTISPKARLRSLRFLYCQSHEVLQQSIQREPTLEQSVCNRQEANHAIPEHAAKCMRANTPARRRHKRTAGAADSMKMRDGDRRARRKFRRAQPQTKGAAR